jgi:hypothetical protein
VKRLMEVVCGQDGQESGNQARRLSQSEGTCVRGVKFRFGKTKALWTDGDDGHTQCEYT